MWAPPGKNKSEWDTPCVRNQPCPAGFYRLGSMPHWEGDCLPCPLHTYKNESGTWNQTCAECPPCEPGFYRDGCGGSGSGFGLGLRLGLGLGLELGLGLGPASIATAVVGPPRAQP